MVFGSYLYTHILHDEHCLLKMHVIPMTTIPKVKANRSPTHSNINGNRKNKQLIFNGFTQDDKFKQNQDR